MSRLTMEQFAEKLQHWSATMPTAVRAGMERAATLIVREVQMKHLRGPTSAGGGFTDESLSRRTSRLYMSINKRVTQVGTATHGQVGTNVPYAGIHEFGFKGRVQVSQHTRRGALVRAHSRRLNMPQRPFLRPSVAAKQATTMREITDSVMRAYEQQA